MPGRIAVTAALALMTAGCTLAKLDEETQAYEQATVLVGRVDARDPGIGAVVVGAYARDGDGWRVLHQTRLHEPGGYELIVPRGEAVLFAFADRNGNGLHDAGEEVAQFEDGRAVHASGQGMVGALDMVLGPGPLQVPRIAAAPRQSTQAGALADLDAPTFSSESGLSGYWQPMTFFRTHGGNVFFLEPYDAAKVPVLFVHGAAGSAQDWRPLIARLDRRRYQPWLFVYPSGAAVESMSNLLYWKLLNLQLRYRFERLAVVAHSMGGLVVRRFALDHGTFFPQWQLFVSLSTPWAGEATAELGVRYSLAVVPSWQDMRPGGPFMQALFERRLPETIEYDLLFGHKGGYSMLRPNNDGTVTLASQLRQAAQSEARLVFGFDEDHTSILRSPQVAAQLQALLDARTGGTAAPRGRVQLEVRADGVPAGMYTLLLRTRDGSRPPITVAVAAADATAAPVGPLPEGSYDASLLADGFAADPRSRPVEIGREPPPVLSFRLSPRGALGGYVGDGRERAAGSFVAPHPTLRMRSITLAGPVTRVLVPRDGDLDSAFERLLAGHDVAWGAYFSFIDLPAGDYELTIDADGYAPHRSQHRVVPGSPGQIAPVVLQPLR